MKTTIEFLDAVKAKHGLESDYSLSKFLGCTRSAISGYRAEKTSLDEKMCLKVADALKLDPAYVLTCMAAERTKSEKVKRAYLHAAKIIAPAALALFVVLTALPAHNELGLAMVGFTSPIPNTIYYVKLDG